MHLPCKFLVAILYFAQWSSIQPIQQSQSNILEKKSYLIKVKKSSIFASHRLGNIDLFIKVNDVNEFHIIQNGKPHNVEICYVDKPLRNMTLKQFFTFLAHGSFIINQLDDGKFSIKEHVRGVGGGPIVGGILYWTTKAVSYVGALAFGAATTAGSGGMALAGAAVSAGELAPVIETASCWAYVAGSFMGPW